MKILKPLTSICLLVLAVTVTIGSMYVTVSAAARQDDAAGAVPIPEPAFGADDVAPVPATPIASTEIVPAIPASAVDDETLAPAEIRSDRQHHISLDANGAFSGTLSALAESDGTLEPANSMQVRLIRDGEVSASTTTAADGSFSFSGLTEGVVALLAYSDTGLMLYGVRLVNDGHAFADATPVKFTPELSVAHSVSSAIISGADLHIARELIFGALPQQDRRFSASVSEKEQSYNYGTGESSTSTIHHAVQLQADGTVKGHIDLLDPRTGRHREIVDLTLHFIRHGELVASTIVGRSGDFEILGLVPGVHSIVTTGEDGILALGIDILGSEAQHAKADGKYKLTNVTQTVELCVCPANAGNFNVNNAGMVSDGAMSGNGGPGGAPVAAGGPMGPMGGGGAMGGAPGGGLGSGAGGGGGVGGGGGGLGALLGAAAAGAIGYAISESQASPGR